PRERAVDGNEIARPRALARDDDLIFAQAAFDRERRRFDRRDHHAFVDDLLGGFAEVAIGVLLHLEDDELLIERAAVDPDAHRLLMIPGDVADGGKLLVAALPGADVARVDAVLVERARTVGKPREQN